MANPPTGHLQPAASSCASSWQEHRTEIDARAGTFQAFEQFGQQLLARGHYASPEIKEKLDILDQERADLEKAWAQRRMMLDHCLELQVPGPVPHGSAHSGLTEARLLTFLSLPPAVSS